jgi:hypothetical protein
MLAPTGQDLMIDFTLHDGESLVTGATPSLSIERESGGYWDGTEWVYGYASVAAVEAWGNDHLEGRYRYTLSSIAVGNTPDVFRWRCAEGVLVVQGVVRTIRPAALTAAGALGAVDDAVLQQFVTVDTGETEATEGSVAALSKGEEVDVDLSPILTAIAAAGGAIVGNPQMLGGVVLSDLTIVQGDDYTSEHVITLVRDWTGEDIETADFDFHAVAQRPYYGGVGTPLEPVACTAVAGDGTIAVSIPLAQAYTAELTSTPPHDRPGYRYSVTATVTDGEDTRVHTLFLGDLTAVRAVQELGGGGD